MNFEGYGYEWDAELVAGPFDGMLDTVIQLEGDQPPKELWKPMDEKDFKKPKLGEKIIEIWSKKSLKDDMKIAVYKLRGEPSDYDDKDEDELFYDFQEITTYKNK
ncbi:MAG: hypothetical protein ACW99G_00280 [Candidatus Thorarchaeota archaeon]|jgi:hypothetical protein